MSHKALLLLRKWTCGLPFKEVSKAHNGIQRCSQFMAHRREKVALQAIGLLNLTVSNLQFRIRYGQVSRTLFKVEVQSFDLFFRQFEISYVANDTNHGPACLFFERAEVNIDCKFRSICADRAQVRYGSH